MKAFILIGQDEENRSFSLSLSLFSALKKKCVPRRQTTDAGMALGTVISLPFSGILADTLGWEAVFYVEGGLAMIWCVLWIFLVYDSPQDHPRIHPKELELFESCMEGGGHGHAVCIYFIRKLFTKLKSNDYFKTESTGSLESPS